MHLEDVVLVLDLEIEAEMQELVHVSLPEHSESSSLGKHVRQHHTLAVVPPPGASCAAHSLLK